MEKKGNFSDRLGSLPAPFPSFCTPVHSLSICPEEPQLYDAAPFLLNWILHLPLKAFSVMNGGNGVQPSSTCSSPKLYKVVKNDLNNNNNKEQL